MASLVEIWREFPNESDLRRPANACGITDRGSASGIVSAGVSASHNIIREQSRNQFESCRTERPGGAFIEAKIRGRSSICWWRRISHGQVSDLKNRRQISRGRNEVRKESPWRPKSVLRAQKEKPDWF
jgi:hypothetical protein